jgi:HPt (histidine-containing phosphotransfer) domain-containing protein
MDIQMPVMDGKTAARLMRERGLKLPIFALTAHAMKGFEQDIMAAGFTGYLTKPIDIDKLVQMLADTLGGQRVLGVSPEPVVPVPAGSAGSKEPAPAESPLISRLADKPRLIPAIQKFTGRLGDQLNAMEKARGECNFTELAALAHWLKGAAGTVGYDAFTEPAIELEQMAKARAESQIEAAIRRLRQLERRIVAPVGPAIAAERTVMTP